MFMDFLRSLSIFGEKASPERIQELLEVVEGQADLDAQFNVRVHLEILTHDLDSYESSLMSNIYFSRFLIQIT